MARGESPQEGVILPVGVPTFQITDFFPEKVFCGFRGSSPEMHGVTLSHEGNMGVVSGLIQQLVFLEFKNKELGGIWN